MISAGRDAFAAGLVLSERQLEVWDGDCLELMRERLPDASVDSIVCDPPYGLSREPDIAEVLRHWLAGDDYQHRGGGFMGKSWDSFVPGPVYWREAFRVLKPGGYLVAFGGTRTYDLLSIAIRMAGFEIRDNLAWQRLEHVFCQCDNPRHGGDNVRGVRRDVQDVAADAAPGETADVLADLQRAPAGGGVREARPQGQGGVGAGGGGVVPQADERRAQSGVEGRRDAEAPERELQRGPVRPSADVGAADGASGRLRDGTSPGDGDAMRAAADQNGGGPSLGPRSGEQQAGEPGAVAVEWIAQGGGAWPGCPRCSKPLAPPFAGGPLSWEFGQGFPKSLDVSKAIDKAAGAARAVIGRNPNHRDGEANAETYARWNGATMTGDLTAPATADAERWQGWGTALKPAHEPIVLARKPLAGTVAGNVLEHGTGAINVDGCRIAGVKPVMVRTQTVVAANAMAGESTGATGTGEVTTEGRWPANVILGHAEGCVRVGTRRIKPVGATAHQLHHGKGQMLNPGEGRAEHPGYRDADGMEEVESWECVEGCPVRLLDEQSGESRAAPRGDGIGAGYHGSSAAWNTVRGQNDSGGASRFFYTAKASSAERNAGLSEFEAEFAPTMNNGIGAREHDPDTATPKRNTHPTVKPIAVLRWLQRLVTPPGGLTLDMFAGSGSGGCAAALEGFQYIGMERGDPPGDPRYAMIARARIAWWAAHPDGMELIERLTWERKREAVESAGQDALF
jgi:DNA modification methylase